MHLDPHEHGVFPHDEAADAFRYIWASDMAATGGHYGERVPDLEGYAPDAYRRQVRMEI